MTKTQLTENLYLYSLTKENDINILVLVNGNKALLIDTGYPEQAKELKIALAQDGLQPEIILNSHYHPDHINGNFIFANCRFMGSEHYKQNFELFEVLNPALDYFKPTTLIKNGQVMNYGSFELKFLHLPGHCRDLLVTIINQEWVHVTDLIMLSNTGKHTLPYISYDGSIEEHLQSLEALKSLQYKALIPSHGIILTELTSIQHAIEVRQYYLQQLKALGKSARVEDCLCDPKEDYFSLNFHQTNLDNIYRA